MGPAKPEHGGLHLSATRVDTFRKCKRKWAFEYIARVPYAPSPWLAFGTLFHAHAERYFGTGKLPDLALLTKPGNTLTEDETAAVLFMKSLKHWPKYRPNYFEVERSFSTSVPGGLFTGSVDLVLMLEQIIGDHKTTSDLKWAPDVGTLITWPQPVCYSYNTAKELGWKENRCRWVYTEKVTGRTQVVHTKDPIPFSYWEDEWLGKYVPLTTEMATLHRQGADPLELSGASDTDFCEAYGGCQFRHICPAYKMASESALYAGFDDDGETDMAAKTDELDALLGATPEAPEQEIDETRTAEPDADLDALFNPPARTDVPKVDSKAPALVNPAPTAETEAKAQAEADAKPKKAKPQKGSKRALHVPEVIIPPVDIAPEARQALDALKAMNQPEPTSAPAPNPEPAPEAPARQVPPPGIPQIEVPQFIGDSLALLVAIYIDGPQALGPSYDVTKAAVVALAQKYQGSDLIVRACDVITNLRKAFG